jgi:arylsulfatase A-like enzyme
VADVQPNVLLVVLDSARAQNTSLHGYEHETTPFLETFGERSTVYTQARAPSIHSIASHVSMFTGLPVEAHEATRHTAQIDTTRTVWHDLATRGYATGLFTNNQIVSGASNLGDSFEETVTPEYPTATKIQSRFKDTRLEDAWFTAYDRVSALSLFGDARQSDAEEGGTAVTEDGSTDGGILDHLGDGVDAILDRVGGEAGYKSIYGGEFVDDFLAWESTQSGPWAACLNLMDPHSPYEPASEFDQWADEENWQAQANKPDIRTTLAGEGWDRIEALEPLYDGGIRQADEAVRELIDGLDERGVLDNTLVILTSDHGEAFGEQSRLKPDVRLRGHKWGIPEVLTHVPLVIKYPGQQEGGTVEQVVSLTDLPRMTGSVLDAAEQGALSSEAPDEASLTADSPDEDPMLPDGPVLASTFRIPEKKRAKYSSIDGLDEFVGPWRAVYEDDEGVVRKYAQTDEHYATMEIDGTDVEVLDRDPHERVAAAYEGLTDDEILTARTADIDDDLESRLEDLGYMR